MNLKRHIDFLNEGIDSVNWRMVEEYIKSIKNDDQFDDQSDNFMGFININPKDSDPGMHYDRLLEFLKAFNNKKQSDRFDELMDSYGLYVQSYDQDEELIIGEIDEIYKNQDPIEFLKERGCIEKNGEWSCSGIINISNNRSPLVIDGKLIVQFNKVGVFNADACGLTTLEGCPKKFNEMYIVNNYFSKHELAFYMTNRGYNNLWVDLLNWMLKKHPGSLNDIKWPEGFLTDNLIKSAKSLSKFNL